MANTKVDRQLTKVQLFVIFIQAIAVGIVGLKVWYRPPEINDASRQILSFATMPPLNLTGWQLQKGDHLQASDVGAIVKGEFESGTRQFFQQQSQTLMVSRAIILNSEGDLKSFIKSNSPDLSSTLYFDPKIGHYSQFFQGDRLTMTACLSAQGYATVTADQFKVTQIKNTLSLEQIGGWLLNRHTLVPQTCHWRSLSLFPIKENSAEQLQDIWQQINLQETNIQR